MSTHRKNRSIRKTLTTVAVTAAALALVGVGGAVAAGQIGSPGIKDDSLRSQDYRDGSVHSPDLADRLESRVNSVPTRFHASDPTTVVDVGGTFGKFTETVRATQLDSFVLQPGKYVIDAEGFYITNFADAGRDVRMQLALRVNDGSEWGQDFGTAFTGTLSPLANREASVHTTRVVTVTATTEVLVLAFGYEDDQGSGASGQVDARSYVTVTKVAA